MARPFTSRGDETDRQFFKGLGFIGLLVAAVALTVFSYQGGFVASERVTVVANRAGLTMTAGTSVKLYGVPVGTVREVEADGTQARLTLDIDRDKLDQIPADVRAELVPPTAFGAKFVQLVAPTGDNGTSLRAGSVIRADKVTVEINEAFTNLTKVLDAARPADVNNALTALASAVDQRGESLGTLIEQVDSYLTSFNPSLQTLSTDIKRAQSVAETFDQAAPDLVQLGADSATTADTLVSQEA